MICLFGELLFCSCIVFLNSLNCVLLNFAELPNIILLNSFLGHSQISISLGPVTGKSLSFVGVLVSLPFHVSDGFALLSVHLRVPPPFGGA